MVATVWCEPIEAWLSTLVAAGRRAETIRLRRYQLERVAAGVAPAGPWEVTTEQLVAWLGRQDWERETRRSWRSALQGFYRWAHRRGLAAVDPTFDLERIKPFGAGTAPDARGHRPRRVGVGRRSRTADGAAGSRAGHAPRRGVPGPLR